jgi:hypothetical protein
MESIEEVFHQVIRNPLGYWIIVIGAILELGVTFQLIRKSAELYRKSVERCQDKNHQMFSEVKDILKNDNNIKKLTARRSCKTIMISEEGNEIVQATIEPRHQQGLGPSLGRLFSFGPTLALGCQIETSPNEDETVSYVRSPSSSRSRSSSQGLRRSTTSSPRSLSTRPSSGNQSDSLVLEDILDSNTRFPQYPGTRSGSDQDTDGSSTLIESKFGNSSMSGSEPSRASSAQDPSEVTLVSSRRSSMSSKPESKTSSMGSINMLDNVFQNVLKKESESGHGSDPGSETTDDLIRKPSEEKRSCKTIVISDNVGKDVGQATIDTRHQQGLGREKEDPRAPSSPTTVEQHREFFEKLKTENNLPQSRPISVIGRQEVKGEPDNARQQVMPKVEENLDNISDTTLIAPMDDVNGSKGQIDNIIKTRSEVKIDTREDSNEMEKIIHASVQQDVIRALVQKAIQEADSGSPSKRPVFIHLQHQVHIEVTQNPQKKEQDTKDGHTDETESIEGNYAPRAPHLGDSSDGDVNFCCF